MNRASLFFVVIIAGVTVLLDQVTKSLILGAFQPGEIRTVIDGLFNLTLTYNRGAAFGLWSGLSAGVREAVLALTIAIALLVVAHLLTRPYYQSLLARTSLAAILGGAIGNVIDRVRFGAVVDFLDFYVGASHWPAFNVADSAICVGVCFLIFAHSPKKHPSESPAVAE